MSREKQDTTAFGFSLEEILKTVVDDDLRDVLGSELVELGDLRKQTPEIRKDSTLDSLSETCGSASCRLISAWRARRGTAKRTTAAMICPQRRARGLGSSRRR